MSTAWLRFGPCPRQETRIVPPRVVTSKLTPFPEQNAPVRVHVDWFTEGRGEEAREWHRGHSCVPRVWSGRDDFKQSLNFKSPRVHSTIDFTEAFNTGIGLLIFSGDVAALLIATSPLPMTPAPVGLPPGDPSIPLYARYPVNPATVAINVFCAPCNLLVKCACVFDGRFQAALVSGFGDLSLINITIPVGPLALLSFKDIIFQNAVGNGDLVAAGAGMYLQTSSPRPWIARTQSCVFKNCIAFQGGAVQLDGPVDFTALDTIFENNTLFDNTVAQGSAVANFGATMTMDRCIFRNNVAPRGLSGFGTLFVGPFDQSSIPGSATLLNCAFVNNKAQVLTKEPVRRRHSMLKTIFRAGRRPHLRQLGERDRDGRVCRE